MSCFPNASYVVGGSGLAASCDLLYYRRGDADIHWASTFNTTVGKRTRDLNRLLNSVAPGQADLAAAFSGSDGDVELTTPYWTLDKKELAESGDIIFHFQPDFYTFSILIGTLRISIGVLAEAWSQRPELSPFDEEKDRSLEAFSVGSSTAPLRSEDLLPWMAFLDFGFLGMITKEANSIALSREEPRMARWLAARHQQRFATESAESAASGASF